jgi:hypothetical protein
MQKNSDLVTEHQVPDHKAEVQRGELISSRTHGKFVLRLGCELRSLVFWSRVKPFSSQPYFTLWRKKAVGEGGMGWVSFPERDLCLPVLSFLLSLWGKKCAYAYHFWNHLTVGQFLHLLNEPSYLSVGAGNGSKKEHAFKLKGVSRQLYLKCLSLPPNVFYASCKCIKCVKLPSLLSFIQVTGRCPATWKHWSHCIH